MAQIYPGTSQVAQNRRNFCNPDYELEKLREISDEDVVKILGHRAPGEEYKSVHPPLDEMDEPDDIVRELVTPIAGAKAGDRIRYIQFVDSMYFAPARERDIERISKYLLETEYFDTARTGIRGAGVHGHSLRLDENGLMFDMLRRQVFNKETGNVEMVRDQIGVDLDEPVVLGEPLDEETLKSKTTIYRIDGEAYKDDTEAVEVLKNIHVSRSFGAFNPVKGWD